MYNKAFHNTARIPLKIVCREEKNSYKEGTKRINLESYPMC